MMGAIIKFIFLSLVIGALFFGGIILLNWVSSDGESKAKEIAGMTLAVFVVGAFILGLWKSSQ